MLTKVGTDYSLILMVYGFPHEKGDKSFDILQFSDVKHVELTQDGWHTPSWHMRFVYRITSSLIFTVYGKPNKNEPALRGVCIACNSGEVGPAIS